MQSLLITILMLFSYHNIHSEESTKEVAKPIYLVKSMSVADEPIEEKKDTYELFEITAYSNHYRSTGKNPGDDGYGVTASGVKTKQGVTIAADWDVLPKGTTVWIEGVGKRVVQDTGSAIKGKKIDVYFLKESDAIEFGRRKNVKVKVMEAGDN